MFDIFVTEEFAKQLKKLKKDKGLQKRYKAIKKTLSFLQNPRHPGLCTHEFKSLTGPNGEKIFDFESVFFSQLPNPLF